MPALLDILRRGIFGDYPTTFIDDIIHLWTASSGRRYRPYMPTAINQSQISNSVARSGARYGAPLVSDLLQALTFVL